MKQNIAEIQVSYKPEKSDNLKIATSSDAQKIFKEFFSTETIQLQEHFMAMYLDRANNVLGVYPISMGGITGTVADVRLILGVALKSASVSIVLAHNHPSSNLKPSRVDEDLTKRIKEAAHYMDIKVLDHIILGSTDDAYFSFADEGIL
jgi:DNA repair protein RadC